MDYKQFTSLKIKTHGLYIKFCALNFKIRLHVLAIYYKYDNGFVETTRWNATYEFRFYDFMNIMCYYINELFDVYQKR